MSGNASGIAVGTPWGRSFTVAVPPSGDEFHEDLPNGAVTDLDVGNVLTDIAVLINYAATRGSNYQMGSVFILCKTGALTDQIWDYHGDDIGLTITSYRFAPNFFMRCTVDASSADHVDFDYVVEIITL